MREFAIAAALFAAIAWGFLELGRVEIQAAPRGVRYVDQLPGGVWIDPETGCEYLASSGERRNRADGTQICDAEGIVKP